MDGYYMPEPDEREERILRITNCLGLFAGTDFETAFENACYMCGEDPEAFDEWDLEEIEAAYR